ncbi:heterokaryon incompatibility protein-domain-containing protein, partial [Pyrenochaeta sp. MPI-SDFR-AT-0127]
NYEAMSYVWGDENADQEIQISGDKFLVRPNVLSALRRFRDKKKQRVLWIDAICINQLDMKERNQQVQLMTEIYSRASVVLIWFGADDSHVRSVFPEFRDMINEMLDEPDPTRWPEWVTGTASLFTNTWFERAWIFQEVICSKKAEIYCGSRDEYVNDYGAPRVANSLPWERISRFYELNGESGMLEKVPSGYCTVIGPLNHYQKEFNNVPDGKNTIDLLNLLELRRDSKATDPKDKVFSLLGLLSQKQRGLFRADYKLSVREVYRNISKAIIRFRMDLRVLSAVQQPSGKFELPSWVPDW